MAVPQSTDAALGNNLTDSLEDEVAFDLDPLFEPNVDCICDLGDIILLVDDGFHPAQKLRVSSCILAMSSKVSKALFSKQFAEGRAIQGRSSAEPYEIKLEDQASSMQILCHILRHKSPFPTGADRLTSRQLRDLAIMVDKYDCIEHVRLPVDALLQTAHELPPPASICEFLCWEDASEPRLDMLVTAAYLFDQPRHFRLFTRLLVLYRTVIDDDTFDPSCLKFLPEGLATSLLLQQNVVKQELARQITALIDQIAKSCQKASRESVLFEFLDRLREDNLWPIKFRANDKDRLSSLLGAFQRLMLPIIALDSVVERKVPRKGTAHHGTNSQETDVDDPWHYTPSPISWTSTPRYSNASDTRVVEIIRLSLPNTHTLKRRAGRVRSLCVGVCLHCIRGRDCPESHKHSFQGKKCRSLDGWGCPASA